MNRKSIRENKLKIGNNISIMGKERDKMTLKYIIYREAKYYVAQCLNVDVSSFGDSIEAARDNLKEALELYFEDEKGKKEYIKIDEVLLGDTVVNV